MTQDRRECRTLARDLAAAIASLRSTGELSGHASRCQECARRVRSAASIGESLRQRPEMPAALSKPEFLEGIFERASEAFEAGPVGRELNEALRVPMPAELPWPAQEASPALAARLRAAGSSRPGWAWQHVRAEVQQARRVCATAIAVRFAAAASIMTLAVFAWRLSRSEGTTTEVPIVFIPVSELNPAFHPTAVLRQGTVR